MRAWTWMAVVGGLCVGGVQAQELTQELNERKDAAQTKLSLRLTDEVVKKAVRETLAEEMRTGVKRDTRKALSGDAYRRFEQGFSAAEKPSCLGPNALKFQPSTKVVKAGGQDYVVGVAGLFALPFWAAAVVRGKCN